MRMRISQNATLYLDYISAPHTRSIQCITHTCTYSTCMLHGHMTIILRISTWHLVSIMQINELPAGLRRRTAGTNIPCTETDYSPEYRVLQKLAPQVRKAIQYDLPDLSLHLMSCGMITEDDHEDFTNEMTSTHLRASNLLKVVQSRVSQNPLNYATFVSVLEGKGPRNYYQSILSQLSHALMDESAHSTDASLLMKLDLGANKQWSLHKYYRNIIIFTLIHFLLNIIIRILLEDDVMVLSVTAAQIFLSLYIVFMFVLGVVIKDVVIIEAVIFGLGVSIGVFIFVGLSMILGMSFVRSITRNANRNHEHP